MTEDYKICKSSTIIWKRYRVSPTTVLKRSKSDSLENKSSAPKVAHRKHEIKHLYMIYYLYEKEKLNGDEIQEYLESQDISFPRSSMYYYLNSWWMTTRRKKKEKYIGWKFKEYDPGFLHVDISYGPKIDGVKYYFHVAIDRATRLMYTEVHDNKRADTAATFLESCRDFFPFTIQKVLTDNGKEYTLKNHKGKHDLIWAFDIICEAYAIDHRTTLPAHPQTNGMVEKLNDTIKNNTIKKYEYESGKDLKKSIIFFVIYYNSQRRHSALQKHIQKKTPYEALKYYFEVMPEIFTQEPRQFFEKLQTLKKNL